MQIGVISGPSVQEAKAQISYAAQKADALEIRADLLVDFDPYALLKNINMPIILTKGDKTLL
ncbi:MAG: type I 3-dehydroquinate dehydratase, partial [Chlamydiae bacterium]|nr:type I 3-dehydroquinate dehydratase [Chlamydiota bacterium]